MPDEPWCLLLWWLALMLVQTGLYLPLLVPCLVFHLRQLNDLSPPVEQFKTGLMLCSRRNAVSRQGKPSPGPGYQHAPYFSLAYATAICLRGACQVSTPCSFGFDNPLKQALSLLVFALQFPSPGRSTLLVSRQHILGSNPRILVPGQPV